MQTQNMIFLLIHFKVIVISRRFRFDVGE